MNSGVRDDDGRRLDHGILEVLRLRAVAQVEAGASPADVAKVLGMNRATVFKWVAAFRSGGKAALAAKPVPGRPPRLTGDQVSKLYDLIVGNNPDQLQFEFALWTRDLIRQLIEREFRVRLSVVSVGRWLKAMGLSPQRPLYRAYQADPEGVAAWKSDVYPSVHAAAKADGATIYFVDEASVRSDYHAGTTWAPVGRTPVVNATGARFSVNMISAISAQGALRFSVVDGTLTADKFIGFCKRLVRDAPGPVYLIVDGHPVHRSKAVSAYIESTQGRLRLFRVPAYSPQLNPDEWVWKNVKHDRVGRSRITGPDQFKALAVAALRRLQRMPHIVRGFFGDPQLAYITQAETVALHTT